jgi:hypothetical protein
MSRGKKSTVQRTLRGHTLNPSVRSNSRRWRLLIVGLAFPSLALAYIDPGTGAYVVQGVLALFATVAFYVSHPRQLVKRVLGRFFRGGSESDTE